MLQFSRDFASGELWPVKGSDGVRVGRDLEAITIADEASDKFYVADERDASVHELSIATKGLLLRSWNLLAAFTDYNKTVGVEALSFVRNAASPEGGSFLLGLQRDGSVYEFTLPIRTSNSSTNYTLVGKRSFDARPCASGDCLAALTVAPHDGALYALWGENNATLTTVVDNTLPQRALLPRLVSRLFCVASVLLGSPHTAADQRRRRRH